MTEWQSRTALLLGEDTPSLLHNKHVLIVGVGGVGAYAAEMICRAGIGNITIIDGDTVNESNINRQLVALHSTIGQKKIDVLANRLMDINPELNLTAQYIFLEKESIDQLLEKDKYDYIIDAIDTLTPKVSLISTALKRKIKIISSMGAGGRVDPSQIKYADIADTYHCKLAKAVRVQLRKAGISSGLKVVFSTEQPDRNAVLKTDNERNKKSTVGTVSYLPATFGCFLAAFVIRKLSGK